MSKTLLLVAALCAVVVAAVGASSAVAGEITGPPYKGPPVAGGIGDASNSTAAVTKGHASICAFSGLNDFDSELGQTDRQTQTPKDAGSRIGGPRLDDRSCPRRVHHGLVQQERPGRVRPRSLRLGRSSRKHRSTHGRPATRRASRFARLPYFRVASISRTTHDMVERAMHSSLVVTVGR